MKLAEVLLSLVVLGSCNSGVKDAKVSDVLHVSGKTIVFISISQAEYDARQSEEGIDEVISDFNFYTSEAEQSLDTLGIKFLRTHKKDIIVHLGDENEEAIKFDTTQHIVATLFTNGKDQPKLEYGVLTDLDISYIVNSYYGR